MTRIEVPAYQPRTIAHHGSCEMAGWRVKIYGVSAGHEPVRVELLCAAKRVAAEALPSPAHTDDRYGLGFVIAHDAADYCFALVAWWARQNELHQRMYSAPLDRPSELRVHDSPAIGCVWELAVTGHERLAWLRHVLANPDGPDVDAYLNAIVEERI